MSSSRPVFRSRWLPYVLVAPQLIITLIFFIWPAGEALWYSLQSVCLLYTSDAADDFLGV